MRRPIRLSDIFDAVADRYPERAAIEIPADEGHRTCVEMSYRQVREKSDVLAEYLKPLVHRDAMVAVLLGRGNPDLYIAQLAIMKAGAAHVCLDARFPNEHMRRVLDDAQAVALIADAIGRERLAGLGGAVPRLIDPSEIDSIEDASQNDATGESSGGNLGNAPNDSGLAYVIYTSGTTGMPKGVLIEHRSVVNLVLSNVDRYGLTPDDRVGQNSSSAYDSSIEETWLAFAVGATLVPMDDQVVRLGPDLPAWMRKHRLTVFCPPPTLLRTMACADPRRQLPDLKFLYMGGEVLTDDLVAQWSGGRRMENSYGPTECAIVATRARVIAGEPITIGKPVPGNTAYILDGALNEVPPGQSGELCFAGIGLARGYHRSEALTREKFPIHPLYGRIYRTGDLARLREDGDLEYLGRIDAQVKLRGYRVELSAVEATLVLCPGVRAAGCRVQGDVAGQLLAAHVVPANSGALPSVDAMKAHLRQTLPEYMVPALFTFVDRLPTTVGGKLDRKSLPDIALGTIAGDHPIVPPASEGEKAAANAFKRALKRTADISVNDDFFLDLGGDSLAVVGVILALREIGGPWVSISPRDVYEARTARKLAVKYALANPGVCARAPGLSHAKPQASSHDPARPLLSTTIQAAWVALEIFFGGAISYLVAFKLLPSLINNMSLPATAALLDLLGAAAIICYVPLSLLCVLALTRLLIGRYRPMRTPIWGSFFTRHWIVTQAAGLIPWWLLEGTVFTSAALRMLGAKVGRRVHIHRGANPSHGGWDLLTIGDDVTLSQDSSVRMIEYEAGHLVIGPIAIGNGATLDVRSGMSPGSCLDDEANLATLSWLPRGACIGRGERWEGIPARPAGISAPTPELTYGQTLSPIAHGLLMVAGRLLGKLLIALPLLLAAWLAPIFFHGAQGDVERWIDRPNLNIPGLLVLSACTAGLLAIGVFAQAFAVRALGRVRPGVYGQWSWQSLRIWSKTGLLDSVTDWLWGTIFWTPWLSIAGMKIGKRCEFSALFDVLPETVTVGEECFFADGIYLASPICHRGTITVRNTTLGRGTFLGNHAVIPAGHDYPPGMFVGVCTVPDPRRVRPESAWFGQPPMELPRRQVISADRSSTFHPSPLRYLTRLFWESLRFLVPLPMILVGIGWYMVVGHFEQTRTPWIVALGIAPLAALGSMAAMCLVIIALKWALLGRTRPGQHPFWSGWCARWDLLIVAWGTWAHSAIGLFEGTLIVNAFLRLTGVRIGKRVMLGSGSSQVVDPDMLIFEDDATISCHFQAHSFEDRVMKMDTIRFGRGSTLADGALVFYGAIIGNGANVLPHGVVMKYDHLPENKQYAGCPVSFSGPGFDREPL
ncbi:MAG TPA: amino acid adenylation domain-containing protein [Tepidisphaeraceae bacterium]|nr:amino acid adenylation domain-containing protein [Tepidisphaeraceae bacterium]